MGGQGSGRPPSAESLIQKSKFEPKLPIADELFIPNLSGDHSAGRVLTTPTTDTQIVNKKYVDDKEVESFPTSFTAGSVVFSDGSTLAEDNANLFWDDTNNRLGVRTNAPGSVVQVEHTGDDTFALRIGDTATPASDTGVYMRTTGVGYVLAGGSGALHFGGDVSTTDGIHITGANDIGIGLTGPTEKLHLYSVTGDLRINLQNAAANSETLTIASDAGNDRIDFSVTAGQVMTFDDSKNVGIGTTTPTAKFSVAEEAGISLSGSFMIKLTNASGHTSAIGEVVEASTTTDMALSGSVINSQNAIGAWVEAVANGSAGWVQTGGIAKVRMDAGGCSKGDRIITSSNTAGYGEVWNTGGAVATHFQELGHALEDALSGSVARIAMHFN